MAEYLGGKKASAPLIPTSELGEEYSHDALAEKMRKQREDMIANDIARQIRQIDDNIRRIDETILKLERERNPSPMLGALRSGREENIRKKVQLTNGSQIQDAVNVDVEEMRKDVQRRHARGEATDEELIATGEKDFGVQSNKEQFHNTYRYEELFSEDVENGDTILTFPDEVIEQMGLEPGDNLAISAVNGSLVIKKI